MENTSTKEKQRKNVFHQAPRAIKYKMMEKALEGYINAGSLPCVGASRCDKQNYSMGLFPEMGTSKSALMMWDSIYHFLYELPGNYKDTCQSYVAIFDEVDITSETHFETLIWAQLHQAPSNSIQKITQDEQSLYAPNDADFSLKIGSHHLRIIGMHPKSPRHNRRFPWPVLIFYLIDEPVNTII